MTGDSGLGGNLIKRQMLLRNTPNEKFALAAFHIARVGFKHFCRYLSQLIEGVLSGGQHTIAAH